MRLLLLSTVILFLFSCQSTPRNYEEVIDACREEQFSKQQELLNSGKKGFIFPVMDCIYNSKVPAFEAQTLKGKTINPSYFQGKMTILNFWFTSCKPCVAEIPGFNKLVEKYGTENFNYLAIGKDTPGDIEEFLQIHPWDFEIIPAGTSILDNTFKTMWGYPTTMVIDENGIVVGGFYGGKTDSTAVQEVQDKVEKILTKM